MSVTDVLAALVAPEPSEPRIELLGVELTGAAAWAAFLVSLISIGEALVALCRWVRDQLIPIRLEAFVWIPEVNTGQQEVAQLMANIYNGEKAVRDLNRLEVWYDPGWWKRRIPGWHLKEPPTKPTLQRSNEGMKNRPVGWSSVFVVAESPDKEHKPLIVIAGFKRKRVRARRARTLKTPIYVPEGECQKT